MAKIPACLIILLILSKDWETTIKDETPIERLKMLRNNRSKTDWWNEFSEEEKNAIDKGLADIEAGRVKPHKEVKKLYEMAMHKVRGGT